MVGTLLSMMTSESPALPHESKEAGSTDGPPLSIAHVLVSLEVGGAERLVVDVARAQANRGHRVAVFVLGKSANPILGRLLSDAHLPVTEFERRRGIDWRLIPRLAAAFREMRPDIVHTHNEPPLIYGTPAARLSGATAIHTCHGPRNLSRGAKLLARGAARITHRYVACTGALVETLRSSGDVPRDKLIVIDNGVDLERFQVDDAQRIEARVRLGIPEAAFVIGSVGRLAPEKNYGFLMRAAEPLLSAGAHLVFVGDGSERGRLEAQAAASGCPAAVHFSGAQSDVAPFLAAMDVFSLSSTFEGLPLALLEAMATGRTVVASAIGGIPLVVEDGITGLLVASGDEAGFTAALRRVRDDKALAKSLGEAGRSRAIGRYGLRRMLDEYEALYREAMASRAVSKRNLLPFA
jgi:glycosyltransferase involved in cell wall biosynthesis